MCSHSHRQKLRLSIRKPRVSSTARHARSHIVLHSGNARPAYGRQDNAASLFGIGICRLSPERAARDRLGTTCSSFSPLISIRRAVRSRKHSLSLMLHCVQLRRHDPSVWRGSHSTRMEHPWYGIMVRPVAAQLYRFRSCFATVGVVVLANSTNNIDDIGMDLLDERVHADTTDENPEGDHSGSVGPC